MGNSKDFKPTILRKAVLLTLLAVTIVLLGLVEYACRVLPKVDRKGGSVNVDFNSFVGRREVGVHNAWDSRWAESDKVDVPFVDPLDVSPDMRRRQIEVEPSATSTVPEETEAPGTSAPPPALFLQTASTSSDDLPTVSPSAQPPDEFLQTTSSSDENQAPATSAPPPNEFLQTTTTSADESDLPTFLPSAPAPDSWLQTSESSLSFEIESTQAIDSYLQVTPTEPATSVSASEAFLQTTSEPIVSAPAPTEFLNSVVTSKGLGITHSIRPSIFLSSVATVNGKPTTIVVPAFTTLITTKGTPFIATIPATATPTGSSKTDTFINNLIGGEKDTYVNGVPMYFLGAYLPVILATFFALPWTLVGETTKSLEPFYQMAAPGGAPAERSVAANFNDLLAPLWALLRIQWTVVLSTALAWLAALIVPLAPEAVFVYVGNCSGGCNGRISVFLPAARAIEAALAAMVLFEIVLVLSLWRKKTGVSADPRCIAGLATLLSDPDVQREFSEIYISTDPAYLNKALKGHNYRLESFCGVGENNMTVAIIGAMSAPEYVPPTPDEKHQYTTVSTRALDQQPGMRHGHTIPAIALAIFIAALLAVIITYRYTGGETGFERFMSGQSMGVKFLFTSIAVAIAWFWARLFRAIALYAPYRRLISSNATARESILVSPPIHPVLGVHAFVSSGNYLLALIAAIGLLSEVLCVTLSAIPFNPATLWTAYNVSTWISVAILVLMLLALISVYFYREPIMPVKPDTIAGNMVYLCDGSLADMFKDLGGHTTKERNEHISRMGLRYEMGYAPGPGGSRLVVLAVRGGDIAWQ
ncbi:hypothetical protein DPSP01_002680 [Paraphaeosphaeria sporulosa]